MENNSFEAVIEVVILNASDLDSVSIGKENKKMESFRLVDSRLSSFDTEKYPSLKILELVDTWIDDVSIVAPLESVILGNRDSLKTPCLSHI